MPLIDKMFEQGLIEIRLQEIMETVGMQKGRINDMLGIELTGSSRTEKSASFELPLMDWEMNPNGVLHGGMSAAMMDFAMGILANAVCRELGGRFAPTVNMDIHYLLPVPMEGRIAVSVKLISSGGSLLAVYGEAAPKGTSRAAVTATGTYKVMK